jgi:hypothetical protein
VGERRERAAKLVRHRYREGSSDQPACGFCRCSTHTGTTGQRR